MIQVEQGQDYSRYGHPEVTFSVACIAVLYFRGSGLNILQTFSIIDREQKEYRMLTQLETRVLNAIREHYGLHQVSPTIAEIAGALNMRSRGTVHRYVQSLIKKQQLERVGDGWRGLRLVHSDESHANVSAAANEPNKYLIPLLGKIAAGLPIEAIPDETHLDLTEFFIGPDRYALRVTGDSMIDAGIMDGDTVILRNQKTARSGDIVVALIDGQEATLKRLGKYTSELVELIPENSQMQVMIYSASRVSIQGVLVGQMRGY